MVEQVKKITEGTLLPLGVVATLLYVSYSVTYRMAEALAQVHTLEERVGALTITDDRLAQNHEKLMEELVKVRLELAGIRAELKRLH